jgi:hypothetical protein
MGHTSERVTIQSYADPSALQEANPDPQASSWTRARTKLAHADVAARRRSAVSGGLQSAI